MTEQEKVGAIHALMNVLSPRAIGNERVKILSDEQEKKVSDKLVDIVNSLKLN